MGNLNQNFISTNVISAAYDNEDNLFLGLDRGLFSEKLDSLFTPKNSDLLYTQVHTLKYIDGKLWYSANDVGYGYFETPSISFKNYSGFTENTNYHNQPLFKKDSVSRNLYIYGGYTGGFLIFKDNLVTRYPNFSHRILDLGNDRFGNIWISKFDNYESVELFKVSADKLIPLSTEIANTPKFDKPILAFEFIGDSLFIGTENSFYLYDGKTWIDFLKNIIMLLKGL